MPLPLPKPFLARSSLRKPSSRHALRRSLIDSVGAPTHSPWPPIVPRAPCLGLDKTPFFEPPYSRLARSIPPGAWDSHMHVLDPDKYPLAPDAAYRPHTHTVDDALSFASSVGIDKLVVVQPSIYGYDNSCVLDALRKLGPRRGRGVVAFDPKTTTPSQLREWHSLGVRGVRLNIQSHGACASLSHIESMLHQYAEAVGPLNWVVQVYVPMSLIDGLEPIMQKLDVRFCIDHLGHPCLAASSYDPYQLPGFPALARLLEGGKTFVKLSAPYRMSCMNSHADLAPVAREIIRLKGKSRVVFATDWPHTRFEGLDIRPWMETVLNWCGNDKILIERLFKGNSEELWDA